MMTLRFILIGLVIGSVSGMMGIGGGVLLVPALMWLCGFEFRKAAGTSLAVLVPPIGLPAAMRAFYEERVDLSAAIWIAIAFTVGAYGGSALVRFVPDAVLRFAFGSLMIYIAIRLMLSSSRPAATAAVALATLTAAWTTFFVLHRLGRRHLAQPDLGRRIQQIHQEGHGDPEYHI